MSGLAKRAPVSPKNYSRFIRFKFEGKNEEAIAAEDGVSIQTVRVGIREVELYRAVCNQSEMEAAEIGVVMSTTERQKDVLEEAMAARRIVRDGNGYILKDAKNQPLYEPDHSVRLKAVELVTQKVERLQPKAKAPTTNVNVGVGVGVAPATGPGGGYQGYEDRLRNALQRRQEQLSAAPVITAEESESPADST